jgi:hypothetical protein
MLMGFRGEVAPHGLDGTSQRRVVAVAKERQRHGTNTLKLNL